MKRNRKLRSGKASQRDDILSQVLKNDQIAPGNLLGSMWKSTTLSRNRSHFVWLGCVLERAPLGIANEVVSGDQMMVGLSHSWRVWILLSRLIKNHCGGVYMEGYYSNPCLRKLTLIPVKTVTSELPVVWLGGKQYWGWKERVNTMHQTGPFKKFVGKIIQIMQDWRVGFILFCYILNTEALRKSFMALRS